MAVELMPERWLGWPPPLSPPASPRISFSGDDTEDLLAPGGNEQSPHGSSTEFDFGISGVPSDHSPSFADELFSGGFILPLPLLRRESSNSSSSPEFGAVLPTSSNSSAGARCNNAISQVLGGKASASAANGRPPEAQQPSCFWRFGRSSSLHSGVAIVGSEGDRISPLPLLPRSKSEGSNATPSALKRRPQFIGSPVPAPAMARGGRSSSRKAGSGSATSGLRNSYYYGQQQHLHGGGGWIQIKPVLNLPAANFYKGSGWGTFGLGRLFCSGKDRSSKKMPIPIAPP